MPLDAEQSLGVAIGSRGVASDLRSRPPTRLGPGRSVGWLPQLLNEQVGRSRRTPPKRPSLRPR